MSNRDTYNSSIATAETTKTNTLATAVTTFQETVNAKGCNVGYITSGGNYTNFATAVANANAALIASRDAAERAKQASFHAARETLRGTGDLGPL
jgi:hypothetical protein